MATRKIKNSREYNATMKEIDALMKKGEYQLTNAEAEQLKISAQAARHLKRVCIPSRLQKLLQESLN